MCTQSTMNSCLLSVVGCLLLLLTGTVIQAQDVPRLSTAGYLLLPSQIVGYDPESYFMDFRPRFSPSGQYVLAVVVESINLRLLAQIWDTDNLEQQSGVEERFPDNIYDLGNIWTPMGFAISPDERFLAVQDEGEVLIFSFPDIELQQTIPAQNAIVDMSWSYHSLLAVIDGINLTIYDQASEENTFEAIASLVAIDAKNITLEDMQNGWLIDAYEINRFTFCQWQLEACVNYSANIHSLLQNGNEFVTRNDGSPPYSNFQIWRNTQGTEFEIRDLEIGELDSVPEFSLSGRYYTQLERYGSDRTTLMYDSVTSNQLVIGSDWWPEPSWFLDESYFVNINPSLNIKLFEPGNPVPIQDSDLGAMVSDIADRNPSRVSVSDGISIVLDSTYTRALVTFDFSALLLRADS
jgi:hypothetical protein